MSLSLTFASIERVASWTEETLGALRASGRRNGGARRAVVELLGRQECCLTAQEIFDELRAAGRPVGRASIYRALEQLTSEGHVQRVELGGDQARFEPVHAGGAHHHHHLVCDGCGRVEAFADEQLEQALHALEDRSGYDIAAHDVVLHGRCGACA